MSRAALIHLTALSLMLTMTLVGCASKSDLQALDQRLSEQLQSLSTTVSGLRTDTQALHGEVERGEAARGRVMEQIRVATAATERTLDTMTAAQMESRRSLQTIRQDVIALGEHMKTLPALMTGLDRDLRALHRALLGLYQVEETAMRERLKALEAARQRIEQPDNPAVPTAPAEAGHQQAETPASLYDVEDATARERLKALKDMQEQLQHANSTPGPEARPAP